MALAAFVLGLMSCVLWMAPFFGYITTVIGLVVGIKALRDMPYKDWKAVVGIVLCSICLILTIVETFYGFTVIKYIYPNLF